MNWNTMVKVQQAVHEQPTLEFITVANAHSAQPILKVNEVAENPDLVIDFNNSDLQAPTVARVTAPFQLEIEHHDSVKIDELSELTNYLPYAVLPYFADKHQRSFTISHSAQTLDGRIATVSGDSKWIGNDENLTHAHKMRALCDGVLIGANTMRADSPQLTVRHVSGNHPMRIILGGDPSEQNMRFNDDGPYMHICNDTQHQSSDVIYLDKQNDTFDCKEVLRSLYQRGINSIYIEGGAITTSHFFRQRAIDQVQVHVAPTILGSGKVGFQFEGVRDMNDAHSFSNPRFVSIGDQMMFIGEADTA